MANVVLVYPRRVELMREVVAVRPPLCLLHLAACLGEAGYSAEIIDLQVEGRWREKLGKALAEKPLFVGVSALIGPMIACGLEVSEFIKKRGDVPVVWGGVHARLAPQSTIENELIDVVAYGEGEETVVGLADYYSGKKALNRVPGIMYKEKSGSIHVNPLPQERYDLDRLPHINLDLTPLEEYRTPGQSFFNFRNNDRIISFESSRGCMFRCKYCVNSAIENKWRGMSAEKVIEHLRYLKEEFGVSGVTLIDDDFFADEERALRIAEGITEEALGLEFYALLRAEVICRRGGKLLKHLSKAGFRTLFFGAESGSNRVLSYLKKGQSIETVLKANRIMACSGIKARMGFIVGFPYEEIEDTVLTYLALFKILRENPNATCSVARLIPNPGSPAHEDCVKLGLKKKMSLREWSELPRYGGFSAEWLTEEYENWTKRNTYLRVLNLWITDLRDGGGSSERKNNSYKLRKKCAEAMLSAATITLSIRHRLGFYRLNLEDRIFRKLIKIAG